jgi:hypothetical protein
VNATNEARPDTSAITQFLGPSKISSLADEEHFEREIYHRISFLTYADATCSPHEAAMVSRGASTPNAGRQH